MHNGNKTWNNLLEQGQFTKELYRSIIQTKVCGSSTLRWRWKINLSIMLEMFGRELLIICQDRISFGLNMPTWKNWSENTTKLGMYLLDGWNGLQEKKHGCPLLNFNRGWASLKKPRKFYTNIYNASPLWQLI